MEAKTKLWFTKDGKPVMGEGKADLLRTIDEEHSLRKTCEKLGISYKHAWLMLKKMNERFGKAVVVTVRGGKKQGTFLTDFGRKVLVEYEFNKELITEAVEDKTVWENIGFKITARNKLKGKVTEVLKGDLVSKVKIEIEPATLTSIITEEAVENLDIKPGDQVYAVIKSTEVMIAKIEGTEKN